VKLKKQSGRSFAGLATNRIVRALLGTRARVVRAYEEWFAGYGQDPRAYLSRTFEEMAGYDEIVSLRNIRLNLIANITSRLSLAKYTSHICPNGVWSGFLSSPGS
jgi:hypothetical protein